MEVLRELDSYEEFFWLLEQRIPMVGVIASELRGATTVAEWERVVASVQDRHPFMSCVIRKLPGRRPHFCRTSHVRLSLEIVRLEENEIASEMKAVMSQSFGDGSNGLLRVKLIHGPERCFILLALHHAAFDGKSGLLMLQDILRVLAGEDPGDLEVRNTSIRELLKHPQLPAYRRYLPEDPALIEKNDDYFLPDLRVQQLTLGQSETYALLRRVKEEKTSVLSTLIVAFYLAGSRHRQAWCSRGVHSVSPFDIRQSFNIDGASGLLIGLQHVLLENPDESEFWNKSRKVRNELLSTGFKDIVENNLSFHDELVIDELTVEEIYEIATSLLPHDLMVTNYAGLNMKTEYGRLRMVSLYTGSPSAGHEAQKISVLTVNGQMAMTLVSREPIPDLLEDARAILHTAVACRSENASKESAIYASGSHS